MSLLPKVTAAWFGFLALAFVNGAVRELGLRKYFGMSELLAHQLSCLSGVMLFTGFALLIWNWLGIETLQQAILTGVGWFFTTMVFETFVLNRKMTSAQILGTYNVLAGQFWGLVLIWIGVLPIALYWIHRR